MYRLPIGRSSTGCKENALFFAIDLPEWHNEPYARLLPPFAFGKLVVKQANSYKLVTFLPDCAGIVPLIKEQRLSVHYD